MTSRPALLIRIYRLKLLALGLGFALAGLFLSLTADWLESVHSDSLWISITNSLADVLLVTGAIGIAVDFFTGRAKEEADTERLRSLLHESAPAFRDAVITGFAETPEQMRGVATEAT